MKLPLEFLNKMNSLMGDYEFQEFFKSYEKPRQYGLRVNTLKISVEEFLKISPFNLEPVPWTRDGFYISEDASPGKHPFYHAGLYYIQEPSAMFPAGISGARPGERVLDLCAAPGGKAVQVAAALKGKGLIVANEISSSRAKALVKNIELLGVRNAIVTNESPQRLAGSMENYFDRILVDAPCSGEGMFRKDDEAIRSWEKYRCETFASMQKDILICADRMLKPGGILIYSTCTFSPEENEMIISWFLKNHSSYEVIEIPAVNGIEKGRPEWAGGDTRVSGTVRLWPHRLKGEGHFTAVLLKKLPAHSPHHAFLQNAATKRALAKHSPIEHINVFRKFQEDNLNIEIEDHFIIKGKNLYYLPEKPPELDGVRVFKFGWYLGEFINERFSPAHSMVMSLNKEDIKNVVDFDSNSRETASYLKGETILVKGEKGLTAVCINGYTAGWAKQTGYMLKNIYPKGWRKLK